MLDVNLLSKNVRAKKDKEIERIIMAAPRLADQTKGLKAVKKPASINFFSRFFKRSAPKPAVQDAPVAAQSILQTPKEVLPLALPQVPPSPLKPTPIPEVMKVQLPQKPTTPIPVSIQPKTAPVVIKKPSDGIILPDISSIVQKNIEIPATRVKQIEPIAPKKPAIPPPPPIKKIEVTPFFEKKSPPVPIDKINIGTAKEALPTPKPQAAAMPQKEIRPAPSVWVAAGAGILSLVFAASFIIGSFFVLNRWVLAFEKVETTYQERSEAVGKIIKNVSPHAEEAADLMQKTQILYEIFKAENKSEN